MPSVRAATNGYQRLTLMCVMSRSNDRHCKLFLHYGGRTTPGIPRSMRRQDDHGNTYNQTTDCPAIIGEHYFPKFGRVDQHNRYRHASLKMESTWTFPGEPASPRVTTQYY